MNFSFGNELKKVDIVQKYRGLMVAKSNQLKDIQQISSEITVLVRQSRTTQDVITVNDNALEKAITIVEQIGATDELLLGDLDYFINPHGTISLELEHDSDGKNTYLHIETGTTTSNWQFRVNGERTDFAEDILHENKEAIVRGISCYNDYL